jgi:PAS domain S-box-containing protein
MTVLAMTASAWSLVRRRDADARLSVYVAGLVSAGSAVMVWSIIRLMADPPGPGWFILVALTIVTGLATLRMPVVPVSFSVSDTFTITAALLYGPEAGALAVAIDGLTISLRLVRRDFPAQRVLFNATAPMLAMWIAACGFFWLAGAGPLVDRPSAIGMLIVPLAIFAAAYFVLNTGLIAGAIALEQSLPVFGVWRQHFLNLWLTFFGGASIAALVMLLLSDRRANVRLVALVLPLLAILYLTLKSAVARMRDEVGQLSSLNRMYQSLIDGAAYGITRAAENGQLLAVNPALVAMLGYDSAEQLQARNLWSDVSANPEDRRSLTPEASSENIRGVEVWWKRNDGRLILVRVSGRLVRSETEGASSVELMVEDVTDRRGLEEQLRQAQKLDAVGRLARGVAHDFNNLLTVIMGSGALIGEGLQPDDPMQTEVRQLMSASGTAASLTRQLLAFSRQQPNRAVELDVNEVIASLTDLLKRLVGARVTIATSLGDHAPTIMADRSQIEQIILNLAINARDAMPAGGRLTIDTAGTTGSLTLRMADTGTGMSEEVQTHIFEPFFTTKGEGKGTGLGLATVYGIVKQSGGEITVASRINEGTVFTIVLPAAAQA